MTEHKDIGMFTAEIKAVANEKGSYDLTLSVPTEDRDGEVIDAKAFEPLPDWIPIDVDHDMTVLSTVGSGVPTYDGDNLKLNDYSFASTPFAQGVKTLVDERHIRKMSVAFMNAVREVDEKDGKPHIRKAELLNAAIVAISSNREADILIAAKSLAARAALRAVEVEGSNEIEVVQPVKDEGADDTKTPAPDPEDTPAATAAGTPPVAGARARAEAAMAEAALLI